MPKKDSLSRSSLYESCIGDLSFIGIHKAWSDGAYCRQYPMYCHGGSADIAFFAEATAIRREGSWQRQPKQTLS